MASHDFKAALKQIREAIRTESYSKAIAMCKEILEVDAKNYMGYLLLGAAYQNNNTDEAARCLRKAVEYSPGTPTLALQGLANCAPVEELPNILEKLLDLVPEKAADYYEKLYQASQHQRIANECFRLLKAEATQFDGQRQATALKYLGQMWVANNNAVSVDDEVLYKLALETCVLDHNMTLASYQCVCKCYLKLLYKRRELADCTKYACQAVERLPEQVFPYEWICKIYCENFNKKQMSSDDWRSALKMSVESYANKLVDLNNNSSLGILVQAIDLYSKQQLGAARELLYKAQSLQPNYAVTLELLVNVEMTMGSYELSSRWCEQLGRVRDDVYALCLSHSNEEKRLNLAVDIFEENNNSDTSVEGLARCYFKLGAVAKLNSLRLTPILAAEYLRSPSEALNFLEASISVDKNSFEALLLYGKLHIKLSRFDDALAYIINATRLQPHSADCFFYLGQIYYARDDTSRARKCFEKSLYLNPICETAVNHLSVIYQQQGEPSLNEALLLKTLSFLSGERSKGLYYRLGLHYLTLKRNDEAIQALRVAIKFDVGCQVYWESLGDAYNERGSYNSALRIFQKVHDLNPEAFYAKLQIALLKSKLRMHFEAIEDFDVLTVKYADCLPVLKGAAEAHIGLAQSLISEHRYGRSKEHLQLAVNHLQQAFLTVENHKMVWLWRLAANTFLLAARLPAALAFLDVDGTLAERANEKTIRLSRTDILDLSLKFLTRALKLKKNTFLWYELAICSYYCSDYASEPLDVRKYLNISEMGCRNAIQEQSNRWQNWNLLGIIYTNEAKRNLALAQHCFVQALSIDRKSYTSWTNLGVMFIHVGDIKLANLAFQRAQQSSPTYPNAWIGQGMLAEVIGEDEEAFDLFRHCQQFEYHPESALGYAHWVCSVLSDSSKWQQSHYKHALGTMHAEAVALDAINWYVRNEESNASLAALSFRGLLNVRSEIHHPAVQDYVRAAQICTTSDDRDKMHTNLGYLYLKLKQTPNAVEIFKKITRLTVIDASPTAFAAILGLALAYCRSGEHQEAYALYNSVLKNLATDMNDKAGHILVAMAAMVYASQGEADTKTILYQCILLDNPPIQALYSACALGILHQDKQLAETILSELKKYEELDEYCAHIAFLTAECYLAENKNDLALVYLKKRVHSRPHQAELREVLAKFIVTNNKHSHQIQISASRMALSSIELSHGNLLKRSDCIIDASNLLVASRALTVVNKELSSKLAQRAIHLCPQNKTAWIAIGDSKHSR